MRGLRLALSWLTVLPLSGLPLPGLPVPGLPVDAAQADRRSAAAAIRWAPVVGLLLGAGAAGVLAGLAALGVPALVAGVLTVGALALASRGMHVDGLADTADGLGCYGPPKRALQVLRDGQVGAFGATALVVLLGGQAAALAALASAASAPTTWPATAVAVVVAVATGRAGFAWCCRRGTPAARPDGLGALVAGSQPWWVAPLWWLALAVAAVPAVPDRPWQGPLAVAVAAAAVVALCAHTARRFGGTVGDVHGAACELSVTAALVVLSAGA